jgi:hypothetical protein
MQYSLGKEIPKGNYKGFASHGFNKPPTAEEPKQLQANLSS